MLRSAFIGVQKLHLGGREDAVERPWRTLGDGERANSGQALAQLIEVNASVVEEEVQISANPMREVDGDGRTAAEIGV